MSVEIGDDFTGLLYDRDDDDDDSFQAVPRLVSDQLGANTCA
jgi:hypothetical protein